MHFLCHYKLELWLESKLEFKLPYRVANIKLLAVVAEDATYYI